MRAWRFNGSLVIAAESWFDARAHAMIVLQTDQLQWQSADARDARIVLRWDGSDFGGTRKLVVEERA